MMDMIMIKVRKKNDLIIVYYSISFSQAMTAQMQNYNLSNFGSKQKVMFVHWAFTLNNTLFHTSLNFMAIFCHPITSSYFHEIDSQDFFPHQLSLSTIFLF